MPRIHTEGFTFFYRDLASDYDRLWDHHFERAHSDEEKEAFVKRGRAFVEDAYYEKGAYAAIVRDLQCGAALVSDWRQSARILKCIDRLRRANEKDLLKRLLRCAIANRIKKYWNYHRHINNPQWGEDHRLAASDEKKLAFDDLDFVIGLMKEMGETEEAARYLSEKGFLEENKRNLVRAKPDPRDMSEDLFWEVIEAGRDAGGMAEQVSSVTEKLATFSGRNIQKFRKILEEKILAAYRWDVWALAYLAQGGCSDDAFEYFRAWLVLQGRDVYSRGLANMAQILDEVPSGLVTQAETLLYSAEEAYTLRTGNTLKPIKSKYPKEPTGKSWDETSVLHDYPEVAAYYGRA